MGKQKIGGVERKREGEGEGKITKKKERKEKNMGHLEIKMMGH